MGGAGGTSLRDQSGALAKAMSGKGVPGTSVFAQPGSEGSAVGSLSALGAGPGLGGVDEEGAMLPDDDENGPAMGVRSHIVNGGHAHAHAHGHSHRFGLVGKICTTASMAMGGPMGQLLGFDRFTKGKAVKGLTSRGGNPFDMGVIVVSRVSVRWSLVLAFDWGYLPDGFFFFFKTTRIELSRFLDKRWRSRC